MPLSPFLRSSVPQPAPLQFLILSLMPHRRIPTLFRIAEVHRPLATLPLQLHLNTLSHTLLSPLRTVALTQRYRNLSLQTSSSRIGRHICVVRTAWQLSQLFDNGLGPLSSNFLMAANCVAIMHVTKDSTTGNVRQTGSSPFQGSSGSQGGVKEGSTRG